MMISKEIHTETEFSEDLAEALKNVPPEAKWKLEGIITGLKMATQAKTTPVLIRTGETGRRDRNERHSKKSGLF